MNHKTLIFGIPLIVVLAFLVLATPGNAAVTGPCQGFINGQEIHSQEITVPENGTVAWNFDSTGGFVHSWTVQLNSPFGNLPIDQGEDEEPDKTSIGGVANVNDYAQYGVGLYQLTGSVLTDSGTCTGTVNIVVQGNPLTTVAGAIGAGATVIGAGGAAATSVAGAKSAAAAALKP